jgi:hypothetical protein
VTDQGTLRSLLGIIRMLEQHTRRVA